MLGRRVCPIPALKTKNTASDALVGLRTIALTAFIVATLYFGRELLIPLELPGSASA